MPRRVKDARRMADSCSVVHPYYYRNHDTWLQIYGKLLRATDGQGSLVECAMTIPISIRFTLRILHGSYNKFFTCRITVKVLNILK